jgi:hypothetical protein
MAENDKGASEGMNETRIGTEVGTQLTRANLGMFS